MQHPLDIPSSKNPLLSMILSFFLPGLGQIYNDENTKGVVQLVLLFTFWLLSFILIGIPLLIILTIWSMIDAYSGAKRINDRRRRMIVRHDNP